MSIAYCVIGENECFHIINNRTPNIYYFISNYNTSILNPFPHMNIFYIKSEYNNKTQILELLDFCINILYTLDKKISYIVISYYSCYFTTHIDNLLQNLNNNYDLQTINNEVPLIIVKYDYLISFINLLIDKSFMEIISSCKNILNNLPINNCNININNSLDKKYFMNKMPVKNKNKFLVIYCGRIDMYDYVYKNHKQMFLDHIDNEIIFITHQHNLVDSLYKKYKSKLNIKEIIKFDDNKELKKHFNDIELEKIIEKSKIYVKDEHCKQIYTGLYQALKRQYIAENINIDNYDYILITRCDLIFYNLVIKNYESSVVYTSNYTKLKPDFITFIFKADKKYILNQVNFIKKFGMAADEESMNYGILNLCNNINIYSDYSLNSFIYRTNPNIRGT